MAVTYTYFSGQSEVLIHANANASIVVPGAGNTQSNLASTTDELVGSARINSIEWGIGGSATGHIVISRGNSSVNAISHVLVNSGKIENMRYKQGNSVIEGGNIYITFVGSANGYVSLSVKKNA